jgi:adenosine deaminase
VSGASLDNLIRTIPKAELHVHLEGTLEPELQMELAARNGVKLPASVGPAGRRGCRYADLQAFLDLYYAGVAVLRTQRDFHDLTAAYLRRVHEDGARHVEPSFDPQSHTSRGVPFDDVIKGIRSALVDGERALGITWRLIMCFLRDRSMGSAEVTLETARPWRHVIAGVAPGFWPRPGTLPAPSPASSRAPARPAF